MVVMVFFHRERRSEGVALTFALLINKKKFHL
jgi:hypothetical protein